jgi:hypothetical protein
MRPAAVALDSAGPAPYAQLEKCRDVVADVAPPVTADRDAIIEAGCYKVKKPYPERHAAVIETLPLTHLKEIY